MQTNVKDLILSNVFNLIALVLIAVLYFFIPREICLAIGALLFAWIAYSNYQSLIADADIKKKLRQADRNKVFKEYVENVCWAIDVLAEESKKYSAYDKDNSIRITYELLNQKVEKNAEKLLKFIAQYNYKSKQSIEYAKDLSKECSEAVTKLNELSNLVLQVEDSASTVDISYVDDMLNALKEVKSM